MIKLLNNLYLFKGLTADQLNKVEEIAESKFFSKDDPIFSLGEAADSFFVIQHGTVRLELDDEGSQANRVEISVLGTGSHFGEMGFLDNEPRSAHATAASNSSIVCIGYAPMKTLLESDQAIALHVYRELARFLCRRLRLTTLDLSYERSKNLGYL